MTAICVGGLTFTFPNKWYASKYDEWTFYKAHFRKMCRSVKAVDIVAQEPNAHCWLLEVKDYRVHRRVKTIDIADEVAKKVRDTLAGLAAAQFSANVAAEQSLARKALRSRGFRVVLHLEQPAHHSKLFPRAINPAAVSQRLRQLIKPVDPHPLVVEISSMSHVQWTAQ